LDFLPQWAIGWRKREGGMNGDSEGKQHNGLEAVQDILARLGVAGDADWMAVVLFARNLVSAMDLFSEEQKAQIQARTFEQMSKKPLDRRRFQRIVANLQTFLMDNAKMADLRAQLQNERNGFTALYDEMSRVFTDIRMSTVARQDNIQRMGADTEEFITAAGSKTEVVSRLRGMITEMVSQAREEARSWEERARALERTANFDPLLSELYSRRALDAQLTAAAERGKRENRPVTMLFLDVDNFKAINDKFGHVAGDGVLRVLAAIVSAHSLQFGGYAARFGGEELVVLCEDLSEAEAVARAEVLRQDVARCPFSPYSEGQNQSDPMRVTVSIGVAQLLPGQSTTDLVLAADQAMYAAKTQGRNRVVAHSTLAPSRATT
jgi:diguanylate cyclase (GGDEF)-like protein